MYKAGVFGNGESRRFIDLEKFRPDYTLFGCNALHRDTTVDYLICCDRRMVDEALENPQNKDTQIYVRPDWYHYFRKVKKNKNINLLPNLPYKGDLKADHPDHWGSGAFAILLPAILGFKEINIVGFDLYPIGKFVNNIYKDTKNYSTSDSSPVDPSFWIYQINQIFKNYPNSQFVIHNYQTWQMPKEWQKNNVKFVAL